MKVVFTPSGRRGSFPANTPVLQAARALGVDIDSVCGGRAICGRCQVICAEGSFPKHQINSASNHLSQISITEIKYAERTKSLADGRRLSCQACLLGDTVIDVPAESQVHRQVVRKQADNRDVRMDPATRLHFVHVAEPDMDEPRSDLRRLMDSLATDWQLLELECCSNVLRTLQSALRQGKLEVTVAVYRKREIVAVFPGLKNVIYGVAFDLGSTTIAAHLCDLTKGDVVATASSMNPQIRFGEDLMSRVSYAMMHPEGVGEMTSVVRDALNKLVLQVSEEAEIAPSDMLEISLVANPIMHHIVLGISPVELGGAPFALATDSAVEITTAEIGLTINAGGRAYFLPCIAGHVGADAAGMILAEEPQSQEQMTLLVDVGTNAEIVLGNRKRLVACSSPTGPAFEGAQISCGQRAAPGAIERVRIDPETLEPRYKVIGFDSWSDDKGFTDELKGQPITGICGSGIIEAVAEMYLTSIITEDGVVDGGLAHRSSRIVQDDRTWSYVLHTSPDNKTTIVVTQNDIRQIQLAKAALYAGVKLLMDHIGAQKVERIRLAGAFGSHIDVYHAMVLGLIPDCVLNEVSSAGNAAGTGARIALLNTQSRRIIENLVQTIEKIETATEQRFQEYFVDAMAFPNKTDPFTYLFSLIDKPESRVIAPQHGRTRKRRRR